MSSFQSSGRGAAYATTRRDSCSTARLSSRSVFQTGPLALPGVILSCFQYVTVECTGLGCCLIKEADNWGCHVCCLLTPHPSTPILTDGVSITPVYTVRSAHIFVLGFLQPALTGRISAFHYPSCYLSRGWTCFLVAPTAKCYA